jgi:hypothetical protein
VAENTNRSTTEQLVAVPALQSLISGLAGAAMFGVMAAGVQLMLGGETDWRFLVLGGLAVGAAGFLVMWVLLMLAHWPRRERPAEVRQAAPMRMDVAMPAIPLAFDARDARDFVQAALYRVNGAWQDRDGGASWRAMERKGWTRERWQQGVDWLVGAGLLRWRDPQEHRAGLCWDFDAVQRFLGL